MDSNLVRGQLLSAIRRMPDSDDALSVSKDMTPGHEPVSTGKGYSAEVTRARSFMALYQSQLPENLTVTMAKELLRERRINLNEEQPSGNDEVSGQRPKFAFPKGILDKAQSVVSSLKFAPPELTQQEFLRKKAETICQSKTITGTKRLYQLECIIAILVYNSSTDLCAAVEPAYSEQLKLWLTATAEQSRANGRKPDYMPEQLRDQHRVLKDIGATQSQAGFLRLAPIYREWCEDNAALRPYLFPQPAPLPKIEEEPPAPAPKPKVTPRHTPSPIRKGPPAAGAGGPSKETTV